MRLEQASTPQQGQDNSAPGNSGNSAVELILVPGARPVDLLRKLNENQPQVVHFSSHGNPNEIVLESGEGEAEAPGASVLSTRSANDRDIKKVGPDEVEVVGCGRGEPQVISKSALEHRPARRSSRQCPSLPNPLLTVPAFTP